MSVGEDHVDYVEATQVPDGVRGVSVPKGRHGLIATAPGPLTNERRRPAVTDDRQHGIVELDVADPKATEGAELPREGRGFVHEPIISDDPHLHAAVTIGRASQRARLLETVVLTLGGGDELVIHAIPARRKYLDLLP